VIGKRVPKTDQLAFRRITVPHSLTKPKRSKRPNGTATAASRALGVSKSRLYQIIEAEGVEGLQRRLVNVGQIELAQKFGAKP
jgi:hypothetical protein